MPKARPRIYLHHSIDPRHAIAAGHYLAATAGFDILQAGVRADLQTSATTVNGLASRIADSAVPWEILLSPEVASRVPEGYRAQAIRSSKLAQTAVRKLKDATVSRFNAGVVLYDGEHLLSFGQGLYAVPLAALWNPP